MKNSKILSILKKIIISTVAVVALFFLVITAIVIVDSKQSASNQENSTETTTTIYDTTLEIKNGDDEFVPDTISDIELSLSDKGLSKFKDYIDSCTVVYDYEKYYNIEQTLARYEATKPTTYEHKHDIRVKGKFDKESFYKRIKANNQNFINSDNAVFYKEYKDEELREYCDSLLDMIQDIYKKNPSFDIDSVCCFLYDFKIVHNIGSLSFAAVNLPNKTLTINESHIEGWSEIKNNPNHRTQTLYHETMHIFQYNCTCNLRTDEYNIGVCHEYKDFDINPLAWYWLAEAAAEMSSCHNLNLEYGTYQTYIGYTQTLNFLLNICGDNNVAELENITYTHDTEKFFEIFQVTNKKDKEELIKLMYTIEAIQIQPEKLYELIDKEEGIDTKNDENAKTKTLLKLKEDVLMSLTKLFYRNLTNNVASGGVTLKDVYYLTRTFEARLAKHMSNNSVGYLIFFKDFYSDYLEIQNYFFNLIARENNLSEEKMKNDFQNYSFNVLRNDEKISSNYSLGFLTNEQRNAIEQFRKEFYKSGFFSISQAEALCNEWLKKAPYENLVLSR